VYFFLSLWAIIIIKVPHKTPIPTLAGSLIQSLSIAYFTKKLIPKTSIKTPTLLIKFSPINFSKSGFFSLKFVIQDFLAVNSFSLLTFLKIGFS
tara:strand:+ start:319 stop:600 length:282 start_codon:yes stop_codon:yes gene_type:complete